MSVCIRPKDVVSRPGGASASEGLRDENLVDRAEAVNSAAAFIGTHRLKAIRQTYVPGGKHFPHHHEATEQAYYILSGKARVRIEKETFDVEAGTMLYIPAKADHEVVNTGTEPLVNLLICVDLDEEELA